MSVRRTATRLALSPIRAILRVALYLAALLALPVAAGFFAFESTGGSPRWADRGTMVAAVAVLGFAAWSELRVRSDLGRGEVAGLASQTAHDVSRVAGVTVGIAAATRGNFDFFDRLSASLTVVAAIALAGFGAASTHEPTVVLAATLTAGVLAGVTVIRRSGARRGQRIGLSQMAGLILSYGFPGLIAGAAVAGIAWWAFAQWRGQLTVTQLLVITIVGACIGGSSASVPAQARRRASVAPALAASLRVSDAQLTGEDPLKWSISYRRSPWYSRPQPVAITLHRPPAQVLTAAADLSTRVAEHLGEWEVSEASPARVALVRASAQTIAARQVVSESEGLYSSVPVPADAALALPTSPKLTLTEGDLK